MQRIGIDTGGTFVDVVAIDEETGAVEVLKSPSVPSNPSEGTREGLRRLVGGNGGAASVGSIFHGTTIATNAVLEGNFSTERMGLIVTEGCRDILEIARQTVPGAFGNMVIWIKPERPVRRENVREARERLDADGSVVTPLDEDGIRAMAREYRERGISQIAVSLLHSYINPAHERRIGALIEEEYPEAFVSLSSNVLPEFREYERTLTTVLDVALRPVMVKYVKELGEGFRADGVTGPVAYMKLNAGLATGDEVERAPIYTVMSGPAAGALAGAYVSQTQEGIGDVITLDMGGTSTDICLVEGGRPLVTTEGRVDIYPIKVPMVDVVAIGAGGGSIAWLGAGKSLQVGPRSAGADPGPACYDRGGLDPTLTDAQLFLGRLPESLAGGTVQLDRELAAAAIERLAAQLDVDAVTAAQGVVTIAVQNMAGGVRRVSVQRGRDPNNYHLVPFGGAGPLHAAELVELMGMKGAVILPHPGTASAFGLLVTDVKTDLVRTHVRRQDRADLAALNSIYEELESEALEKLDREGVPSERQRLVRGADMRYLAQGYEVRVPVAGGRIDDAALAKIIEGFHEEHRRTYDYADEAELVELVNLRVEGIGLVDRPAVSTIAEGGERPDDSAVTSHRLVWFGDSQLSTPIYDRDVLLAGNLVTGPAIVDQYDSTTVVPPGFHVRVDKFANLILGVAR